jgi:hypothetical protein
MEAAGCYKTVVPIYKTTWHHITEDSNLNVHCRVTSNLTQYCGKFCCKRRLPSGLVNIECVLSVASDKMFDLDLLVQVEHNRVSCMQSNARCHP